MPAPSAPSTPQVKVEAQPPIAKPAAPPPTPSQPAFLRLRSPDGTLFKSGPPVAGERQIPKGYSLTEGPQIAARVPVAPDVRVSQPPAASPEYSPTDVVLTPTSPAPAPTTPPDFGSPATTVSAVELTPTELWGPRIAMPEGSDGRNAM